MRPHVSCILAAVTLGACVGEITGIGGDDGSGSDPGPTTCAQARTYTGFDGMPMEAHRPTIVAGSDRMRIKPFAALAAEYARALALASVDTSAFAATFGKPPARWFSEPRASANTIYAAFALAFDACTTETGTGTYYASTPTTPLADSVCRDHARRAWHREATDDEAAACSSYVLDHTNPTDTPQRRWAYGCAAVLSASGFLAY